MAIEMFALMNIEKIVELGCGNQVKCAQDGLTI